MRACAGANTSASTKLSVCMRVCMCVWAHMHICECAGTCACMCACVHACVRACVHACGCAGVYTYHSRTRHQHTNVSVVSAVRPDRNAGGGRSTLLCAWSVPNSPHADRHGHASSTLSLTCRHVCKGAYNARIHICMLTCMHAHARTKAQTNMRAAPAAGRATPTMRIRACTHARTHARMHARTHARMCMDAQKKVMAPRESAAAAARRAPRAGSRVYFRQRAGPPAAPADIPPLYIHPAHTYTHTRTHGTPPLYIHPPHTYTHTRTHCMRAHVQMGKRSTPSHDSHESLNLAPSAPATRVTRAVPVCPGPDQAKAPMVGLRHR